MDARRIAMDMLARREHSCYELTQKLTAKGVVEETARQLVVQLCSENLISDERFTEAVVRVRGERGYGPARIVLELREKGVDEVLIGQWVDFGDRDWWGRAAEVRRKKYGDTPVRDYRQRAKQMRFLQSRGFTVEQIRYAMDGGEQDE